MLALLKVPQSKDIFSHEEFGLFLDPGVCLFNLSRVNDVDLVNTISWLDYDISFLETLSLQFVNQSCQDIELLCYPDVDLTEKLEQDTQDQVLF